MSTNTTFANPLAIVTGSGHDITLASPLSSSSSVTGPTVVLSAGGDFVNNAGAAAILPGSGVWRVYSTDPAADTRGGLAADFKQYGFLYRVAPVLAPTLAGTSTKVYDGNTSASLASASVGTSGAIDGDSATFALAGGATFDTRHAGSGKVVSAPVTFVGVSNGAIPVYGYALASGTACRSPRAPTARSTTAAPRRR